MGFGGFSWKRALGITKLRQQIARDTGIPTTKQGRRRKLDRLLARGPLAPLAASRAAGAARGGVMGCLGSVVGFGVALYLVGALYRGCTGQTAADRPVMTPAIVERVTDGERAVYALPREAESEVRAEERPAEVKHGKHRATRRHRK